MDEEAHGATRLEPPFKVTAPVADGGGPVHDTPHERWSTTQPACHTLRSDAGRLPDPELLPFLSVFAISSASGIKLAEVGFLLIVIAGIWLLAAEIPALGLHRARTIVAGAALAAAGVLLIVATHWGHFG
jgi:hypothetical protein